MKDIQTICIEVDHARKLKKLEDIQDYVTANKGSYAPREYDFMMEHILKKISRVMTVNERLEREGYDL